MRGGGDWFGKPNVKESKQARRKFRTNDGARESYKVTLPYVIFSLKISAETYEEISDIRKQRKTEK